MCFIWIAAQRFAVEWCFSPWAFAGEDWKPPERINLRVQAFIAPARRLRPTFMMVQTSRWLALVTLPARPLCFWLSAAQAHGSHAHPPHAWTGHVGVLMESELRNREHSRP